MSSSDPGFDHDEELFVARVHNDQETHLYLFLDRSGRSRRFLEWRIRIFITGTFIALAGIYFDEQWMTGLAIIVLMAGFLMRFLLSIYSRKSDPASSEDNATESERII